MPLSTALPAPSIEIISRFQGPRVTGDNWTNNKVNQNSGSPGQRLTMHALQQPSNVLADLGSEVMSHGGTDARYRWSAKGGRPAIRASTNNVGEGEAFPFWPYGWLPWFNDTEVNPGARAPDESVVLSWTWWLALDLTTAPPNDDETMFGWLPNAPDAVTNIEDATLAGGLGGGVGATLVDDGAGNAQWDWLSWNEAAELERITIPASIIPDVTAWSSFRWIWQTAGSGAPASVKLEVNGTEIAQRDVDDVLVLRPQSYTVNAFMADAYGYMPAFEVQDMQDGNTQGVHMAWEGWVGRFRPDGTEVQSP